MDFSIKVILVVSDVQKGKMDFSLKVILVVSAVQKGKMDFSIQAILAALVKCRVSLVKVLNLTCLQDFSMSEAPMVKQKEMSGQESEIIKRNDMPCVRLRDLPLSMVQVQLRHNLKHVASVLVPQGVSLQRFHMRWSRQGVTVHRGPQRRRCQLRRQVSGCWKL